LTGYAPPPVTAWKWTRWEAGGAAGHDILRPMTTSHARRLILVYTALLALLDLSVLLPGNPRSTVLGFVGAVVVQTLVVWRLWHHSPFAWLFALGSAVLTVVALFLMAADAEVGVILLYVFSIAQAALLCTRPIRAFVWSRPEAPLASS
jgi:hypothetical protein